MAPAVGTLALLVRSRDRGDDDRLVDLLTPGLGRVTALARHARGSRRRFGAALQPFCLFEAALAARRGASAVLESVTAREFPLARCRDLGALGAAWLCLELGDAFSTAGTAHPEFFELVLGGLRRLGAGHEGPAAVRQSVLWGSLRLAGWAPDLGACAGCGGEGPWDRLGLDPLRGGLLCPRCCAPGAAGLREGVRAHWRDLDLGRPAGPPLPGSEGALLRWAEHHLGRPLRSADRAFALAEPE